MGEYSLRILIGLDWPITHDLPTFCPPNLPTMQYHINTYRVTSLVSINMIMYYVCNPMTLVDVINTC